MKEKNFYSLFKSKRLYVIVILFFLFFINYADRTNLSIAAPKISHDLGWNSVTMGWAFSGFLWTYILFLIPMGRLVDKIGTKKMNAYSISLWTIASMLTGVVTSFGSMMASRLVLGVGESASYPTAGKIVRQWFPSRERGVTTSIYNSGAYAGPALSTPIIAWVVVQTSWRLSFILVGIAGFIWLLLWLKVYRTPERTKWLSSEESNYILSNRDEHSNGVWESDQPNKKGLLKVLLSQKSVWGLAITQGCAVYTQYLFLTWLPSYLVQERHLHLLDAGMIGAIPYVAAVIFGIMIGRFSDSLLKQGENIKGNRRKMVVILMLISSVILLTNFTDSIVLIIILMSISLTAVASSISLNMALANDLVSNSKIMGTAGSITIFGGNVFGLVAPIVTGYIVNATNSYNSAFLLAGAILIFGAIVSFTLTRKPIRDEINTVPDSVKVDA